MSFNSDQTKQPQEVIFSKTTNKTNKIIHPPLYLNNATIELTHAQTHLGLQLDKKLLFNKHTNNKISKATKGTWLFRKLQLILPCRSLLIIYKFS